MLIISGHGNLVVPFRSAFISLSYSSLSSYSGGSYLPDGLVTVGVMTGIRRTFLKPLDLPPWNVNRPDWASFVIWYAHIRKIGAPCCRGSNYYIQVKLDVFSIIRSAL